MEFAEVDGRRFAYIRRGQGEPLLLIQGMGAHHQFWGEDLLSALEQHYDIVAFDHRGIGESAWAAEPFSTADLAADAAGIIKAVGWRDAHVFGISLGGMVAQELTIGFPGLVRTLTIGGSWAGGPDGVMSETALRVVTAMATKDIGHSLRTGYEANFSAGFTGHFDRYAATALAVRVPVKVVQLQWEAGNNHDTSARLPTITAPALVIHGTADAMLPVANGRHIAGLIPGARLELLPDVGHLFWWEDPARVASLLLEHAR